MDCEDYLAPPLASGDQAERKSEGSKKNGAIEEVVTTLLLQESHCGMIKWTSRFTITIAEDEIINPIGKFKL